MVWLNGLARQTSFNISFVDIIRVPASGLRSSSIIIFCLICSANKVDNPGRGFVLTVCIKHKNIVVEIIDFVANENIV